MKKPIIITFSVLLAITALIVFNKTFSRKDEGNVFAEVKKGTFEIVITNAGELLAEKSIDIYGPQLGMTREQNDERNQQQFNRGDQMGGGNRQQGGGDRQQSGRQQSGGQQSGGQQSGGQQSGGQSGGGGQQRSGGGQSGGGMQGGGMQGGGMQGGGMQGVRAQDFKIQDMVPEGTIVKKGDYIAQLDRSSYSNTLTDALSTLTTYQQNVEMKILDTAVTLSNLRDNIKNQRYTVEEAKITLDQSQFEPPATIKKAQMNLDKQKRALQQLLQTYELKKIQNESSIRNQKLTLRKQEELVADLQEFLSQFTVRATGDGMVIYKKDRSGAKRKTGSSLNAFDMIVATLPDLSTMISKMYVSEIEVSKVTPGQKVNVTVDAFPSKLYTGTIITVANIGETLPNSDAKMFEVQIRLDGTDMTLRPAMTTWNKIILKTIDNAIYIPLECVQTGIDSIPFVVKKNNTRQVVVLGEMNDKSVIVKAGLEPGNNIYAVPPADYSNFKLVGEKLLSVTNN
jgi:hypothetical protein